MNIITDLQEDILKGEDIIKLLRKAFLISKKLELNDFNDWIKLELKGYMGCSINQIPNYRILNTELKCNSKQMALGGICDISNMSIFGLPDDLIDPLTKVPYVDSISQLLILTDTDNEFIKIKLDNKTEHLLNQYIMENNGSLPTYSSITEIYRLSTINQIKDIIEQVKNELLFWTSKLEEKGIEGSDYNFSEDEIKKAKTINYNFNFYNNSINTNIQINQNVYKTQITKDLKNINQILANNNIEEKIKQNISDNIVKINCELNKQSPNTTIMEKLTQNILELIRQITITSIVELLMPYVISILLTLSNFT